MPNITFSIYIPDKDYLKYLNNSKEIKLKIKETFKKEMKKVK